METVTLDLQHGGLTGAIATYVVLGQEPALVDPGPAPCLERLEAGLSTVGLAWTDVRRVFLTHVHLDHAGATGHIVERAPHIEVVVHRDGAPHMVDPTRLVKSTRRTFGEAHDALWGEVHPVPAHRIAVPEEGNARVKGGLRTIPTPGHAPHHLAFLDESNGTFYAGDSLGIVLDATAPTHPATPPPSLDLAAWYATLAEIVQIAPERAAVTHFGIHEEVTERALGLERALQDLARRVARTAEAEQEEAGMRYQAEVCEQLSAFLDPSRVERYFEVFKASTDWAGVAFYLARQGRSDA